MKFREIIKRIEHDGWRLHSQVGSHGQYKHPDKPGRVTVAGKPGKDVPEGTRKSILGQAGLEQAMVEYTVIYERAADGGWGAYAPDLPGLGVIGDTFEEAEQLIREGISMHIDGLKEDGLPIPEPTTISARVAVAA